MTINLSKQKNYYILEPTDCKPRLVLNVPDGTDFFDIKPEDFELVDYDSVKPQLKFDLAI